MGHGGTNAPGVAHGAGKGAARGGVFGLGHASLGNPTLSSHSQNTSHKGETHGGRSSSNYAQDHTDHSDRGLTLNLETIHSVLKDTVTLGLPLGHEFQADSGDTPNLETIHLDLDRIVTLGRAPGQDLQPDRSDTLNLQTIHSDHARGGN